MQRPVAIFTDGFLYHKNKVADDTLKREAIRRSNRFRVWSLSWKDVQNVFQVQADYATETLLPEKMASGARIYKPTIENENASTLRPYKASAMELLINYLEEPESERLFNAHARAYAFSLLDMASIRSNASFAEWNLSISRLNEAFGVVDAQFEFGNTLFGTWKPRSVNSHTIVYSGVVSDDMQKNKTKADIFVYALLNDDEEERTDKYEAEWNGYWQFVNLMQFLDRFIAVSATGLKQMVYGILPMQEDVSSELSPDRLANIWQETMEQIIDDYTSSFAKKCIELGIPEPSSVGFELLGAGEDIIGEAELAWESAKIAYLTPEQLDSEEAFIANGWQTIKTDDEIVLSMFKEAE